MNKKSHEKAETHNCPLFAMRGKVGVRFHESPCSNTLPSSCAKGKRGRALRDSILLPTQGPENAHCLFALARQ